MTDQASAVTRVRLARPDDAAELAEIGDITVRAYTADGQMAKDHPYTAQLADTASRAREGELLVAVDGDDRLVGTVTVVRPGTRFSEIAKPDELEFRMLAVPPEARRGGVARALVTAVLDRARAEGYRAVVLSSADDMRAAHQLYQRLGFTRDPDRDWSPNPQVSLMAFAHDLTD